MKDRTRALTYQVIFEVQVRHHFSGSIWEWILNKTEMQVAKVRIQRLSRKCRSEGLDPVCRGWTKTYLEEIPEYRWWMTWINRGAAQRQKLAVHRGSSRLKEGYVYDDQDHRSDRNAIQSPRVKPVQPCETVGGVFKIVQAAIKPILLPFSTPRHCFYVLVAHLRRGLYVWGLNMIVMVSTSTWYLPARPILRRLIQRKRRCWI